MTGCELLALQLQAIAPQMFAFLASEIRRNTGRDVYRELGLSRPERRRDDRRRQFQTINGGRR